MGNELQQCAQEPKTAAWMCPSIISFKGASNTSCPEHLQAEIEGTVVWSPELIGDTPEVTDKFGVKHRPMALVFAHPATKVPEPASDNLRDSVAILDKVADIVGTSAFDEVSSIELVSAFRKALAPEQQATLSDEQIFEILSETTTFDRQWPDGEVCMNKYGAVVNTERFINFARKLLATGSK